MQNCTYSKTELSQRRLCIGYAKEALILQSAGQLVLLSHNDALLHRNFHLPGKTTITKCSWGLCQYITELTFMLLYNRSSRDGNCLCQRATLAHMIRFGINKPNPIAKNDKVRDERNQSENALWPQTESEEQLISCLTLRWAQRVVCATHAIDLI